MVKTTPSDEAPASDIQAVARVGQICALFGPDTPELTSADVAERLGLNRTTAYRYCTSLVAARILERGQHKGGFVLGGLMLQLGIYALGRRPIVEMAPAALAGLATRVHMTAVLGLWGGRGPVVAAVEEDLALSVRVTVAPGTVLGVDASQTVMFLAHRDDPALIDAMASEMNVQDRARLDADVFTARRTGYSITELPGGLIGVAAPVFDSTGIAATVALLGADSHADLSAGSEIVTALLETADGLTAALAKDVHPHEKNPEL